MRIQDKCRVSRDGKVVDGERVEQLRRLYLTRGRLCSANLSEAVGNVEDEDNEKTICRALDLEVAEERVCPEEIEGFVNNISLFRVRWDIVRRQYSTRVWPDIQDEPNGAGPRILVLMGRMDMFPTCLTSGSSLNAEWYAYTSRNTLWSRSRSRKFGDPNVPAWSDLEGRIRRARVQTARHTFGCSRSHE
jgi:hypothetical protein